MSGRIFNFALNGNTVLGFDTGLNAQAFAQAKIAQFITRPGFIVYPDGKVETWLQGGVTEHALDGFQGAAPESSGLVSAKTMVVWGPLFPGERLDELLNKSGRQDEALDALRFWIRAREVLQNLPDEKDPPFPGPAGAFIVTAPQGAYPAGTVFFPPARLIKRTLEASGAETVLDVERWVHPDLEGAEAVSFSAAAMLYRIFCGVSPFRKDNPDELRQDIREAFFVPPNLAAPGLDSEMSDVIIRALSPVSKNRGEKPRSPPDFILGFIGPPSSRAVSSWIKPLNGEETLRFRTEQEQYIKKKTRTVKTRRFMIRNAAIITGSLIALLVLLFVVRGAVLHRAQLPTTRGMSPIEVVNAYYSAFDALDNAVMEACVSGRAGRADIELATNLFVISKVRQAYEMTQEQFIPAKEWIEAGRPAAGKTVFGITDLKISVLSLNEAAASFEADYLFWMPGSPFREEKDTPSYEGAPAPEENALPQPAATATRDKLELVLSKGQWRITEISRDLRSRESSPPTASPQSTNR